MKVQVAIKYDQITERIHKSLKRELTRLHKEFYLRALRKVKTQHSWKKKCRQSEIYPQIFLCRSPLSQWHRITLSSDCYTQRRVQDTLVSGEPKHKLIENLPPTDKLSLSKLDFASSGTISFCSLILSPYHLSSSLSSVYSPQGLSARDFWNLQKCTPPRNTFIFLRPHVTPHAIHFSGGTFVGTHTQFGAPEEFFPLPHYLSLLMNYRSIHHIQGGAVIILYVSTHLLFLNSVPCRAHHFLSTLPVSLLLKPFTPTVFRVICCFQYMFPGAISCYNILFKMSSKFACFNFIILVVSSGIW